MGIKTLLDRSIFHGEKFNLLKKSPIERLVARHKLSIYGNPILVEETLRFWYKGQKKLVKEQLNFIFNITNGRWFRQREEVWLEELKSDLRNNKYFFIPQKEVEEMKSNIVDKIIKEQLDSSEETQIIKSLAEQHRKDSNLREICLEMRGNVSSKLKAVGARRKDIKGTFEDYLAQNIDWIGEEMIKSHLPTLQNKQVAISNWQKKKERYPYFTLWLKFFLYLTFHAMSFPNKKVDLNAIRDIGQLVYLQGLDIMVSDDRGFMKDAFEKFYGDKKKFMSFSEFIDFMKSF